MMVIRECVNPSCKFRYPDLESGHIKAFCPKCGSQADIQEELDSDEQGPVLPAADNGSRIKLSVIADNIRSLYNVGSIFRTSDGFGVDELILCGITPTPKNPRFSKTSLGAEKHVRWSYHNNAVDACLGLKNRDFQLFSLEKLEKAESLYAIDMKKQSKSIALVIGNERVGVDPAILKLSDKVLSIPMIGHKSSFNVAVAYGIAVSYFYSSSNK